MKRWFYILAAMAAITACSRETVVVTEVKGRPVLQPVVRNIRDTMQVKLIDIADSLRLVQLETRPECLVPESGSMYCLTADYIYINTNGRILRFNSRGRFVDVADPGDPAIKGWSHSERYQEGSPDLLVVLETPRYRFLARKDARRVAAAGTRTSRQKPRNFVLDKYRRKAWIDRGIFNNYTGSSQAASAFTVQDDGRIFTVLPALEAIGAAERAIEDPKSEQKLIGRMRPVKEGVKWGDNPVVVVGMLRK